MSRLLTILLCCVPLLCSAQAAQQTAIRVTVAPVKSQAVRDTIQATGVIAAYRRSTIAAEVPGQIVGRLLEPGAQVSAGTPILNIDPERLQLAVQAAEAGAQSARVALQHAQHELKRGLDLFQKKVVSQDTLDDLRFAARAAEANHRAALVQVASAERNLRDAAVRAPFDGQLEEVHVQVGDYVNPGRAVLVITDFTNARVHVGVSSNEAADLKAGQQATVSLPGLGGRAMDATTVNVGRIKNNATGTFPVELLLTGHSLPLKEGMVAHVAWRGINAGDSLSVPASAVFRRGSEFKVYVLDGQLARLRTVTTGSSSAGRVEIRSGLNAGEQVVTEGLFALRDGAAVEVAQ